MSFARNATQPGTRRGARDPPCVNGLPRSLKGTAERIGLFLDVGSRKQKRSNQGSATRHRRGSPMWRTPCSPSRAPRGPWVVPSQRQRQRQHRVYHASASGEGGETRTPGRAQVDGDALRERIYIEQPEAGGVTPAPPPVAHSAAFIQKRRGLWAVSPTVGVRSFAFLPFILF